MSKMSLIIRTVRDSCQTVDSIPKEYIDTADIKFVKNVSPSGLAMLTCIKEKTTPHIHLDDDIVWTKRSWPRLMKFWDFLINSDYYLISPPTQLFMRFEYMRKWSLGWTEGQCIGVNTNELNFITPEIMDNLNLMHYADDNYIQLKCWEKRIPFVKLNVRKLFVFDTSLFVQDDQPNHPEADGIHFTTISKTIEKKREFVETLTKLNEKMVECFKIKLKNNGTYHLWQKRSPFFYQFYPPLSYNDYMLFEPHPDDALLSNSMTLLANPPDKIVTIMGGDGLKNFSKGTENYCQNNLVDYIRLPFCGVKDAGLREKLIEIIKEHWTLIEKKKVSKSFKYFLVPCGVKHQEHVDLAEILISIFTELKLMDYVLFYRDIPHGWYDDYWNVRKHHFKKVMNVPVNNMPFKKRLLEKYYKDQHMVFYYENNKIEMADEEYFEYDTNKINILW